MREMFVDAIIIVTAGVLLLLLVSSISKDQTEFVENCQDKGFTYEYCMQKLRP